MALLRSPIEVDGERGIGVVTALFSVAISLDRYTPLREAEGGCKVQVDPVTNVNVDPIAKTPWPIKY